MMLLVKLLTDDVYESWCEDDDDDNDVWIYNKCHHGDFFLKCILFF